MRDDYKPEGSTCLGGINEQVEDAAQDQCHDARNLWVKEGVVAQRPGYVGVVSIPSLSAFADAIVFKARAEDVSAGTFASPSGAGVLTLNGLVARAAGVDGDRWYLGHTATFGAVQLVVPNTNSNATRFIAEYWDGTAWRWLQMVELGTTAVDPVTFPRIKHLSDGTVEFLFVPPNDWAPTTVDGQSAYWLRFTLLEADLDASVSVDVDNAFTGTTRAVTPHYFKLAKFPSTKRFVYAMQDSSNSLQYGTALGMNMDALTLLYGDDVLHSDEPATMAVLPEFDELYIAYNNLITVWPAYPTAGFATHATVEARPEIVGPNAKYSTSYIAQLGAFPRAKYIQYFKGFLWVAGLESDPHGIRWSAPGTAYKVWPLISRESVAESDNSIVRAIYGFGENMLVWKDDSMWQMVFNGYNAFGLADFVPIRVPGGRGCISQSSIVEIDGWLYWLAKDGVYRFNGTKVEPVFKDRIQSVFGRINPARRAFAVGVDWPQFNVYLLAVALDGSTNNNAVLVYDYNRKAWWIWDDIQAQAWISDKDAANNAILYFMNASGHIFQMGAGLTDHGSAISSYAIGRRMAQAPVGYSKRARGVSVISNNLARSLDVTVLPDDDASGDTNSGVAYTDYREVEYGAVVSGDQYTPDRKRTRFCGFKTDCRHFHVKVAHSTKNTPFKLYGFQALYEPLGRRR